MPRALIIDGTGAIGRASASRLLAAGWEVELTGRNPDHLPPELAAAGATFVPADRSDAAQLREAMGDGADLLVDCVCYTAADAARLLPLVRAAGSTVMISSKAVYVDDAGNHANSPTAPRFDGPRRCRRGSSELGSQHRRTDPGGRRSPGRRILVSADPNAPAALGIPRTIARLLGHVLRRQSRTRSSGSSPLRTAATTRSACPMPTIPTSARCSTTRRRTGTSPGAR